MKQMSYREFTNFLHHDNTVTLTEDIIIKNSISNRVLSYIGITKYQFSPVTSFEGVLDGNGYTVHNIPSNLFNTISEDSVVKDISFTGDFAGTCPLATTNRGEIQNVTIKCDCADSDIEAGFVSKNIGSIINCEFIGSISSEVGVGGFCWSNHGLIKDCIFTGTIESEDAIAGISCLNYSTIKSCKVRNSSITGKSAIAGISSENIGEIHNCKIMKTDLNQKREQTLNCGVCCKNVGKVRSTSCIKDVVLTGGKASGLIGKTDGLVQDCMVGETVIVQGGFDSVGLCFTVQENGNIQNCVVKSYILGGIYSSASIAKFMLEDATCSSIYADTTFNTDSKGLLFTVLKEHSNVNSCYYNGNKDTDLVKEDNRLSFGGLLSGELSENEAKTILL